MGPLFVVEVQGIRKGGHVGYFLSAILSQPSFFCFVPTRLITLVALAASLSFVALLDLANGKLCQRSR